MTEPPSPPERFTNLDEAVAHAGSAREVVLRAQALEVVPAALAELRDLEVLDLSLNLITVLPAGLFSLAQLRVLRASQPERRPRDTAVDVTELRRSVFYVRREDARPIEAAIGYAHRSGAVEDLPVELVLPEHLEWVAARVVVDAREPQQRVFARRWRRHGVLDEVLAPSNANEAVNEIAGIRHFHADPVLSRIRGRVHAPALERRASDQSRSK